MTSQIRSTLFVAAAAFVVCATANAQEQSVKPGINDNFKDPSIKRYTTMFEGESRPIFKHRNEIV